MNLKESNWHQSNISPDLDHQLICPMSHGKYVEQEWTNQITEYTNDDKLTTSNVSPSGSRATSFGCPAEDK